jgi:pimeloyl-ACP methyl ester carboxylesterase
MMQNPHSSLLLLLFLISQLLFQVQAQAQTGFLDKVGNIVDRVFTPATDNSKPELIATPAADHQLPAHWRSYWLNSPDFGTPVFLADTGALSAPVILLVHGLGQNGLRDWLAIIPTLEKHYRVILVDLPGFANSPSPKAKLSPTAYADLLHFIKPYFSSKPIFVVGHSMGGAVTLRYTQRYPENINQAALIDAAGILQRTAFVKHSATDRLPTNPQIMPNGLLSYAVGLQDFSNNLIEKMLRLPDPTTLLGKSEMAWGATLQRFPNVNAALSLTEEDFSSAIHAQSKTIFILWGGKDLVAPLRTGQLLAANLSSSDLTIIEEAGHVPMASHSAEVAQWLIKKLGNSTSPSLAATQTTLETQTAQEEAPAPQDYTCEHSSGTTLRGHYARITLKECTAVLLENVIADELIAIESVAEIQNSQFSNHQTSMSVNTSVIMMTGGAVAGTVKLDKARIDFAGVDLLKETPFEISGPSRLVLSVNRAGKTKYLHGDLHLKNTNY